MFDALNFALTAGMSSDYAEVVDAVTTAFTQVSSSATDAITSLIPIGLAVAGMVIVVRVGKKVFRSVVS